MTAPALDARGLRVVARGVELLRDVGVAVERGRVQGVLGPSGAGKTTLFRTLAGELSPQSGIVLIDGVDVTCLPLHRRARAGLGYVPQAPSVLFDLTVSENISAFEEAARAPRIGPRDRAESVGLEGRLGVKARELSGGERRRLEVLRALIADPLVLLCDEPFSSGDPGHVRLLADLLRAHAARGRAVLLADHRVAEALRICDEALLLVDGVVEVAGSADELTSHPAFVGRYLG